MRIVYFGTPQLAVPTLNAVAEHHEVVAVVTQPDRPRGRSGKPAPPAVKTWALEHGLQVHQPEKLHDGVFEAWLREQNPELCVVAAYGRLLKQPVLDVPPKGWLNLHPSLLPRWRGPSPIQTAILEGDTKTGVTIMRIVLEMDAGDIVLQKETPITPEETAGELTVRLADMGAALMIEAIALVERDAAPAIPQNPARVTISKVFEKSHGRIQWAEPAQRIHNRVRACNPWPMAQCMFRNRFCRILRTLPIHTPTDATPGAVIAVEKDCIIVATGHGRIAVTELQMAGRKALDASAFLRGAPVTPGERFEDISDAG